MVFTSSMPCILFILYIANFFFPTGFVNSILSWSAFIPLSRLTYAAYLLHYLLLQIYLASLKRPLYMNPTTLVNHIFLPPFFRSYLQ